MTAGSDDDAEDDGLKSLRAVWLSMPDEEPPSRGLDALMAAARVKANEMAAATEPSLWQRFVALMRRPPVLALATVTLLIGGVALIGRHGENMAVEPTVSAPAPAVTRSAAPSVPDSTAGSAARPPADLEEQAAPAERKEPSPPASPPPARKPTKTVAEPNKSAPADEGKRFEDADATLSDVPVQKSKQPKAESASGALMQAPDALTPSVVELHREARQAAARGDCEVVQRDIRKIAATDRKYYQSKVVTDPTLKSCSKQ